MASRRSRGTVTKRGEGVYYLQVSAGRDPITDKRRRFGQTFHGTKRQADQELTRILRDMDTDEWVEPSKLTVGSYLDRWLEAHASQVEATTLHGYRQKVQHQLKPHIGSLPLQKLDPLTCHSLFQRLLQDYSVATVKQAHAVLSRACKDARTWGLLQRNPVEEVAAPRRTTAGEGRRARQYAWPKEALSAFLQAVKQDGGRWYPVWYLEAATGLRTGELAGLRWADVELDTNRGQIVVSHTRSDAGSEVQEREGTKTRRGIRVVAIGPDVVEVLREWRGQQLAEAAFAGEAYQGGEYVACDEIGQPYRSNALSRAFARAAEKYGGHSQRLYDLRHTHATMLLEAGVEAKEVSERLGHSSVAFTLDAYAEVTPAMRRRSADAFTKLLS